MAGLAGEQRNTSFFRRSGPAIAVIGLHVLLIYGLVASVGIVELPKFTEPLQAVFIDEPISEPEPEVPEVKPEMPEMPLDEPMPELQFEEIIVPPAEVATTPAASNAPAASETGAIAQDLKTTNRVEPTYPPISRRMGEEGTVKLRVLVNANGRPGQVEVLSTSGFGRLDQAAIEAVKRWRFVAATDGTRPITAWTQVAITFQLKNAQ
jgi:protein TonB